MKDSRVFVVDNFRFANNNITSSQDARIVGFAHMIVAGSGEMPPIDKVDGVVIVGHAKGTRPLKHAILRGSVVRERLIEHLEDFAVDDRQLGKIALGDPVAIKVSSNGPVTGEDRKAEIHVVWTKPKRTEIVPLTGRETKFFVWAVIGKRPKRATAGKLLKEFLEFTDVQSFLKKPSASSAAKVFFKSYIRLITGIFAGEPERKWGVMVGAAYSMLDEATDAKKTRKIAGGSTRKKRFAKGFAEGYGEMRAHLARFGNDKALRRLLQRLSAIQPRSKAMRHIYAALNEVTATELSGAEDTMYFFAREDCKFGYPRFKVSKPL